MTSNASKVNCSSSKLNIFSSPYFGLCCLLDHLFFQIPSLPSSPKSNPTLWEVLSDYFNFSSFQWSPKKGMTKKLSEMQDACSFFVSSVLSFFVYFFFFFFHFLPLPLRTSKNQHEHPCTVSWFITVVLCLFLTSLPGKGGHLLFL